MMQLAAPRVWLGSFRPASDAKLLASAGITHVLCCVSGPPRFPEQFTYLTLSAEDQPTYNMAQHFDAALAFIAEAHARGGSVIVHCGGGISRAPTIVAAHLIRTTRVDADTAIAALKAVRCVVNVNPGFLRQLRHFASIELARGPLVASDAPAPEQPAAVARVESALAVV